MNFSFIHIFWCGFAVSWTACVITTIISDAIHIASDKDSPDWDSK